MSLGIDLITIPEREKSATGDRYDYQALWGLALLFQLHETSDDYAIVFEFHDDIVALDSAVEPKTIRFYQVKSKATQGEWNLTKLLQRPRSKNKEGNYTEKPSHIDKMYDNVHKFKEAVLSVEFVSNKLCNLNSSKTRFSFSECTPADFEKIVKAVQSPYPAATEAEIGLLGFQHTDLSLGDAATHTKGKLHSFITDHLGMVHFSLEAFYQAVVDQVRRKSNFKGDYLSLEQVVRDKGLTRENVQGWLDAIANSSRSPEWSDIAPHLDYSFAESLIISREYAAYRPAALNSGDKALHRVRLAIRTRLSDVIGDEGLSLTDMVDAVADDVSVVGEKYMTPYSLAKLRAMIIYEIYTH